jgi:membrane-associated protease RseP (regulator of RpoE activity)
MIKSPKLLIALLIIVISAALVPSYGQEPCEKCKANPENCKLMTGGVCENPEGCKIVVKTEGDKSTIEKKIVVMQPDMNRGFLGIVTEEEDGKLTVGQVVPKSPAEKAGIKEDDIILAINGTAVKTRDELIKILSKTKPGDTAQLQIKSGDKEKTMKIELAKAAMPETPEMPEMSMMGKEMCCPECGAKTPMPPMCPMMGKCPMMMEKGMPMMPMEKGMMMPTETRGFLGVVTAEEDGKLVVQSVTPNTPAMSAGITEGDIITEINGTPMQTPENLMSFMKTTEPMDIVHLMIITGGVEKMLDVTLGEVPAPSSQQMKMAFKFGGRRVGSGGGAGYFGPGMTFFDFDDLNSIFATHNLPEFEEQQFTFGGGGWGQAGRVRIGGYGIGGTQTISNDTLHIENAFGAGFFELGYSVVSENHLLITPLLGIGGGGISMKITPLLYNPISLDYVLSHPGGVAKVSKGGLMMYPGLSIDIPISFVGLSLKGGYMWSPLTGSWMMEDFGKINGPDLKLSGPFASLNVMFGGFSKHHK